MVQLAPTYPSAGRCINDDLNGLRNKVQIPASFAGYNY